MTDEIEVQPLDAAIAALHAGRPVVLTGAADGGPVMVMAAGAITASWVNTLATHARGLLGMAITFQHAAKLGLTLQQRRNVARKVPLYTLSIEAASGTTTGISAAERAATILAAAAPDADDRSVITPGHIFPQVAEPGSNGQAEGAVTLLRRAGLPPVAAICSMLDAGGNDADLACARAKAAELGLVCLDISALG